MASAAGDRPDAVGDWPFAGGADAFAEYSSVFAELGWPGGLAAGTADLAVLDLPEAVARPAELAPPEEVIMGSARSGDAGASSSSSGDGDGGAARGIGDQKPAASEEV